ncbi:MAG: hypothetical protein ACRCXT_22990 [Paraclostridium sp.]
MIKKILGYLYIKFGTNKITLALSRALDRYVTREQRKRLNRLKINGGANESKSI